MPEFKLKDAYGKEKTFNRDVIFVEDTDGNLVQFTEGSGDLPAVLQPLEVTENGTYNPPEGVDGFSPVTVAVPEPEIKLQDKTITENGTYSADSGFDGLGKVLVEIASGGGGRFVAQEIAFTASSYSQTIEHNLGTIPIMAVIRLSTTVATADRNSNYIIYASGFSSEVVNGWETTAYQSYITWKTTTSDYFAGSLKYTIDYERDSYPITQATAESITIGNGSYMLYSGKFYRLYLVGIVTE